jgi:Mitochondrial carrier protein
MAFTIKLLIVSFINTYYHATMAEKSQSPYLNFIAGGISGVFEVSASHPLDVVKTAMQDKATSVEKVRMNSYQYLLDRFRRGGIRHMYHGYIPRVIGVIPMRAMFWGAQSITYRQLEPYGMKESMRATLAGLAGGLAQTLIDNPIEVMKTRMITSSHLHSNPTPIAHISGPRFPGFGPTLFRNIGFMIMVTQFTTSYSGDSSLVKFALAGAGGFAGSILTQPIDYVKTRVQSANPDGRRAFRIFSEGIRKNPKVLMVGAIPRASLSFVNMGVGYLAFSLLLKIFKD